MHKKSFSYNIQKGARVLRTVLACVAICALSGAQAGTGGANVVSAAAPAAAPVAPARAVESIATRMALGADFSCAVTSTAQVKCWGNNRRYQLTQNVVSIQANSPSLVTDISGASKLAAGQHHACAITSGGLFCWGAALYGQIGNNPIGKLNSFATPGPLTGVERFLAITDTATTARLPVLIALGGTASDIAIGGYHTCAVVAGAVKCWGRNHSGELGDGSITHRAVPTLVNSITTATAIAAGDSHTCALLADATVACWGNNTFGQLGNGGTTNSATPVPVSALSGATAIAAGNAHACAIVAGGAVKCWGLNQYGQLGAGNNTDSSTPVDVQGVSNAISLAAGEYHTCAVISGGAVQCWGRNNNGQLGNNTLTDANAPVSTGIANGASVYAGDNHSCAILATGDAQCWGRNNFGQLGDSSATTKLVPVNVFDFSAAPTTPPAVTPTPVPTAIGLTGIRQVSAGRFHTCVNVDGAVQCWGGNYNGQLGDGTIVSRSVPAAVIGMTSAAKIRTGGDLSCVTTAAGVAQCWGEGGTSRIADGNLNTTDRLQPSTILGVDRALDAGAGTLYHQCVRQENGEIMCWGQAIKGGEVGDGSGDVRLQPVVVSGIDNATDFSANGFHSCAVVQRGAVKCWGANELGQIGDGSFSNVTFTNPSHNNRYTPVYVRGLTGAKSVDVGLFHSCALMESGSVKCWGYNLFGQLGDGTSSLSRTLPVDVQGLSGVVSIAAGNTHSCAVLNTGVVMCWGGGSLGQLGNGQHSGSLLPTPVLGIGNAIAVSTSQDHTCAILTDGQVRCWGNNTSGQLAADPTVYPNSAVAIDTSSGQPLNVAVPTITPGGPTLTPTPVRGTPTPGGWGGKLFLPMARKK